MRWSVASLQDAVVFPPATQPGGLGCGMGPPSAALNCPNSSASLQDAVVFLRHAAPQSNPRASLFRALGTNATAHRAAFAMPGLVSIGQLLQGIEMAIPVDDFRAMRLPTGEDQEIGIRNRFPRLAGPDGEIRRLPPAIPVGCEVG